MRKLKAYVPKDDLEMPKQIDKRRYTAVLIRQSDHRAEADHIFPDREMALKLVEEAAQRGNRSYGIWLYSAWLADFEREVEQRNITSGSLPNPSPTDSSADHLRAGQASTCR